MRARQKHVFLRVLIAAMVAAGPTLLSSISMASVSSCSQESAEATPSPSPSPSSSPTDQPEDAKSKEYEAERKDDGKVKQLATVEGPYKKNGQECFDEYKDKEAKEKKGEKDSHCGHGHDTAGVPFGEYPYPGDLAPTPCVGDGSSGKRIHVVYAYENDHPYWNRTRIQRDLNEEDWRLDASAAGVDQHFMWKCTGPGFVDIQLVPIEDMNGGACCDWAEIADQLPKTSGDQRYLVYVAHEGSLQTYGLVGGRAGGGDATPAAIQADSPYAWYRLNDTDFTARDNSGNGLHAHYWSDGFPTWGVRGLMKGDTAVDFFNFLHEYVEAPHMNLSNGPITLEAYIKPYSWLGDISTIAGIEDATDNNTMLLRVGDTGIPRNRLQWIVSVNGSSQQQKLTGPDLQLDRRYHIVATYSSNNMKLYVNGKKYSEKYLGVSDPALRAFGTFHISKSFGQRYFDGFIDEVAVYRKALSESRVRAHYDSWSAGIADGDGGPMGETPDPTQNSNNIGDAYAITPDPLSRVGSNPLHEMMHTLGAVMWTAPHSNDIDHNSGAGITHCHDDLDVMCFSTTTGPARAIGMRWLAMIRTATR